MMRNIKKYGSLLLLSVVLLAACSKQKVQPKSADVNSENVSSSRDLGCITVSSVEDLLKVKNNLAACYIQTEDIDLVGINFEPIGDDENNPFTGSYDGKGKTISNLKINKSMNNKSVGLFVAITENAKLANITLKNINIIGGYTTGGLVGLSLGEITNSSAQGTVNGKENVGGLVGWNYRGTISNSHAEGTVSGEQYVGGLVGTTTGGTISNSHAEAVLTGEHFLGGLVGGNGGLISYSYATATVMGVHTIGGLVGYNNGPISNSFATGIAVGTRNIGGLVGHNYKEITNSYAEETLTGEQYVGGLVGWNESQISNSFARSAVNGEDYVGGLVGYSYSGKIFRSYAEGCVIGQNYAGGLVGGTKQGIIEDSYSTAEVFGDNYVGGLIGGRVHSLPYTITNSYANGKVSCACTTNVGGLVGSYDQNLDVISASFQAFGTVYANDQNVLGILPTNVQILTKEELGMAVFQNAGSGWGFIIPWNILTQFGVWPTLANVGPKTLH